MTIRIYQDQSITLAQMADPLIAAILISLFSDARLPDGVAADSLKDDPRGWWGDALDGDSTGSLLWLLARTKKTQETLRSAEDYARQSLRWLVDDGIAETLTVVAASSGEVLTLAIVIDGVVTDIEVTA